MNHKYDRKRPDYEWDQDPGVLNPVRVNNLRLQYNIDGDFKEARISEDEHLFPKQKLFHAVYHIGWPNELQIQKPKDQKDGIESELPHQDQKDKSKIHRDVKVAIVKSDKLFIERLTLWKIHEEWEDFLSR